VNLGRFFKSMAIIAESSEHHVYRQIYGKPNDEE
jgi:hypothetical protein